MIYILVTFMTENTHRHKENVKIPYRKNQELSHLGNQNFLAYFVSPVHLHVFGLLVGRVNPEYPE